MTTNNTEAVTPGELDGERGMPSVNQQGPSTAKRGLIVILVLFLVLGAAAMIYMVQMKKRAKAAEQAPTKDMQVTNAVPSRSFEFPAPPPPAAPPADATKPGMVVPAPDGSGPTARPIAVTPGGQGGARMAGGASPAPADLDKSASTLMVSKGTTSTSAATAGVQMPTMDSGQGALSGMLTGTKTRTSKASMLPNRNFLLAKGSFIDCALQTRLDSTVPGMAACVVTRDIYSDNGKVLLIERGSKVTGEYRANMKQGQKRIFVLWTRITTQNGVAINLDSPGTDALGGSGVPGYVDTHFWERFGGAILLSLIDDFARYATTQTNGNNTNINLGNTTSASENMAAEALKNTINIPPTLYVNQGERVGIYVARDLDFGGVYDVNAE